jgi:hypothetical protein
MNIWSKMKPEKILHRLTRYRGRDRTLVIPLLQSQVLSLAWCKQKNGAVSKVDNKCVSHPTRPQYTLSAGKTVQISRAVPAVRFPCSLRGRRNSFQDGVAAGEGFLCIPFWGVQIRDYSASWVSCTVLKRRYSCVVRVGLSVHETHDGL